MRLVSLVPAATEIACALGAADDLVAVTHDDDHPPEVRRLPRVTRTSLPPDATSHEIDAAGMGPHPLGELAQDLVSGVVPEAVVDGLEPVDVEQEDRHLPAARPHPRSDALRGLRDHA